MLRHCGCAVSLGNHHILCFKNCTEDITETTAQPCLLANLLSYLGLKFVLCIFAHPECHSLWVFISYYIVATGTILHRLKNKSCRAEQLSNLNRSCLGFQINRCCYLEILKWKLCWGLWRALNKVARGNLKKAGCLTSFLNSCLCNSVVLLVHITHFNSTSFSDRDLSSATAMIV